MVIELYDALRQVGVDEKTASDAARSVMGIDMNGDLATKSDLALLRSELRSEMSELRSEMSEFRSELRSEMSELRLQVKADISELKVEIIKWNVGAMAILTAIFAAISRLS